METVKGTEGQVYRVFHARPIQQSLEQVWFLWLSDDVGLKAALLEIDRRTGDAGDQAIEVVKDYVDDRMLNTDGFIRDLCQRCQDYTDWQHLTRRLCDHFGINGIVAW